MSADLLIVGHPGGSHLAAHLASAAKELGVATDIVDVAAAVSRVRLLNSLNSRLRGNRPLRAARLNEQVLAALERHGPRWLLVTGHAPVFAGTLRAARRQGVVTLNYSSDDPCNPRFKAPWLMEALPAYMRVYTPREHTLRDFSRLGCETVAYLPFGYNPEIHKRESGTVMDETPDVVFIGGADQDRTPYMSALLETPLRVEFYGRYWERFAETRRAARGVITPAEMRALLARSKMSVCLVRRANRDSHVMRTFEEPAMGACMLPEDTIDHRRIFGEELITQAGFRTPAELAQRAVALASDQAARGRIRRQLYECVTQGHHTYADRLRTMLEL